MKTEFDFQRFAREHGIAISDRGKHARRGWIQTKCVFCSGHSGWHLGFNLKDHWFCCWRCGGHSVFNVVAQYMPGHSNSSVYKTIQEYSGRPILEQRKKKRKKAEIIRVPVKLPPGCGQMKKRHKEYLKGRGFDPDFLEETYDLRATGGLGPYRNRIIAPIYHKDVMVSYQGRDVTGKHALKYKACAQENEKRDHKHCLYANHLVPGSRVAICEGIVDVWKLGPGAVCTFGIKFKPAQVKALSKYDDAFILYDSGTETSEELQAAEQAEKLGTALSLVGVNVEIVELNGGDPGDLSIKEAKAVMKELGF